MWNVSTMEQRCICTKRWYLIQSNLHMWPPLVKRQPPLPPQIQTPKFSQSKRYSAGQGCFPLCQNFRKFRSKRKWYGLVQVEIFRSKWSTSRGGPIETCRSIFRDCRFQSRSNSSLHTVVKMADGSDVSVEECSVGKLQTQDLNFVLMLSCTPGSGTATHLKLFFLLVFISF